MRRDERAQATQVGAVLLLGILVVSLSVYQVTVVPEENGEIEFNGYLDVSRDMATLGGEILTAGTRGSPGATTVDTGVRYPARALFVNPPPPTGTLRTTPARTVTVTGAVAADGEAENVAASWDGSARNYTTRAVGFYPDYNQLRGDPVVTTGHATYRTTGNGPIALTGQSFVSENRITLVTVAGNLSAARHATAVSVDPVSASARSVTVTGDGGPFNVTLAVPGNATRWNESTAAESIRANDRVVGTTPLDDRRVNVTFDGSETYELRLARVEVRETDDEALVEEPTARYVVPADGNGTALSTEQSQRLAVEVRDGYDNPRSGVPVTFATDDGAFSGGATERTVRTTEDGRAAVSFSPDATGDVAVEASIPGSDAPLNATTLGLSATSPSGGTGAGGTDDASSLVVLRSVEGTSGSNEVTLGLDYRGTGTLNATGVRLNYATQFDTNGDLQNGPTEITDVSLDGATNDVSAAEGGAPWFFAPNDQPELTLGDESTESLVVALDAPYETDHSKEAVPFSVTVYYEGGVAGTYSVWLGA